MVADNPSTCVSICPPRAWARARGMASDLRSPISDLLYPISDLRLDHIRSDRLWYHQLEPRGARIFMAHAIKCEENRTRLLAKLVREILASDTAAEFESVGDVVEALKRRCAKLRVPWTNDDVSAALRLVASNVPMPGARVLDARRRRMAIRERQLEQREITRAEASAILLRLGIRL